MFDSIESLDDFITDPNPAVIDAARTCPGDVTVLGAGGKMGFHLCRMLQRATAQTESPARVIAVSRFSSAAARDAMHRHGIETMAADLSDPAELASLDVTPNVFYLAGVKFGTASDASLLQRMNVEMPQRVAEHFRRSRIVALSTGCVYSFTSPSSGGSTESDPLDPPGAYARSCIGREQAFDEGSRRHGTKVTLVRLNYSIDLRYGVLVDVAAKVLRGDAIDLRTGYVNVIWQGDATAQIIQCLPLAACPPTVINVTGPECLAVRDLANQFAERFGLEANLTGTESETCWLSNSAKARAAFGPPTVGVEQMIDWIADWLDRGGETLGKPTQFENREGSYG